MTDKIESPHVPIKPGDVSWSWCSKQMDRTEHLYDGHRLWCLACHPEKDTYNDRARAD
jgi:hypothetical protein